VQVLTISGSPDRGTFELNGHPIGYAPTATDLNTVFNAYSIPAATSDNTSPYTITGTGNAELAELIISNSTLGTAVTITAAITVAGVPLSGGGGASVLGSSVIQNASRSNMSYKPGDTYWSEFTTQRFDTGVATDADSTPTATLAHNGTDAGAVTL